MVTLYNECFIILHFLSWFLGSDTGSMMEHGWWHDWIRSQGLATLVRGRRRCWPEPGNMALGDESAMVFYIWHDDDDDDESLGVLSQLLFVLLRNFSQNCMFFLAENTVNECWARSWRRPPHFFLPNFADSIGPVKVVQAEPEELGGGAAHSRKLVVTKDVEASFFLFLAPSTSMWHVIICDL